MTNEQLEQAIKCLYEAQEVQIFDESNPSWVLTDIGVTGREWRVWYTVEGNSIKGTTPFVYDMLICLVDGKFVTFPWKQRRRISHERFMWQIEQYGKTFEENEVKS